MKVWMWQRLMGMHYESGISSVLRSMEDDEILQATDEHLASYGCYWLCPKPNLVLVDRKHLGGME